MCWEIRTASSSVTVNGNKDENKLATSFSHSYYSYNSEEPREFHDRVPEEDSIGVLVLKAPVRKLDL